MNCCCRTLHSVQYLEAEGLVPSGFWRLCRPDAFQSCFPIVGLFHLTKSLTGTKLPFGLMSASYYKLVYNILIITNLQKGYESSFILAIKNPMQCSFQYYVPRQLTCQAQLGKVKCVSKQLRGNKEEGRWNVKKVIAWFYTYIVCLCSRVPFNRVNMDHNNLRLPNSWLKRKVNSE